MTPFWWMWALSDFSLYLDPRTDPAMSPLMACVQKTQTPPWGNAWHPSLQEQWRCLVLPSHPLKTRASTLWMGADTKPCLLEKKLCTKGYGRVLQRSPRFSEIHGLRSLRWGREILAASLSQDCLSKHIPKLRSCEKLATTPCKSMCSAHCRRSSAQRAESELTGILLLASTLLGQASKQWFHPVVQGHLWTSLRGLQQAPEKSKSLSLSLNLHMHFPWKKCGAPQIKMPALEHQILVCFALGRLGQR